MELGKELYITADYLQFPSNENKNMFSSAFLFRKFLYSISKSMYSILLYHMRLKVVKSKILNKGPVPKKAKLDFSMYHLTLILTVRSMVTKYLVIKDVIHTTEDFYY